jgi:hypothetical protein
MSIAQGMCRDSVATHAARIAELEACLAAWEVTLRLMADGKGDAKELAQLALKAER